MARASIPDRIDTVADRAATARADASPTTTSDRGTALDIARDGVWPTIRIYIDARRTGHRFEQATHDRLERALNDWLIAYAAAYGYDIDPAVPVREAGETFLDTHNVLDTARVLTGVPPREDT
ncbi:MAG: hypothetical protein ABEJ57_08590 [Halobacteriaceae archaeon]